MMFVCHGIAKTVGTAIAGTALSLGAAGMAVADSTDDGAFFQTLAADGVMFSGSAAVYQKAQVVCEAFSAGMSPEGVQAAMLTDSAMSPQQMAVFIAISVQFYCPR